MKNIVEMQNNFNLNPCVIYTSGETYAYAYTKSLGKYHYAMKAETKTLNKKRH